MKRLSLFFILAFILLSINIFGQNIYIGKIIGKGTPAFSLEYPPLPCLILWLETTSGDYILSIDSHWICDSKVIVDNIEYRRGDEVEIMGTVRSAGVDIYSEEHFSLEIETIKKKENSNIESLSFSNNKVYYDATKLVIMIDETSQNQSLMFELVDLQGKVMFKQTTIGNTSISIANLPDGVYLYRLFLNNQEIYFGKILK